MKNFEKSRLLKDKQQDQKKQQKQITAEKHSVYRAFSPRSKENRQQTIGDGQPDDEGQKPGKVFGDKTRLKIFQA